MVTSSERGQVLIELLVICCFLIGFAVAMAALGSSSAKAQSQYRFHGGSSFSFR